MIRKKKCIVPLECSQRLVVKFRRLKIQSNRLDPV